MIGYIVFGVVTVVSLPIILPVMFIRNMIDARYQRRISNEIECERCGNLLGETAILESNRVVANEWKQMQEKFPGVKFRRVRRHHAICIECGKEYLFSDQGKTYLPVTAT